MPRSSHLEVETPTDVIVPESLAQRRSIIEAKGGNMGAVRAVTQGENPEKAHKDFLAAARYAERFGKDVNQVFKTPELLEQAHAVDASERMLAKLQTPEAQEQRIRELSQAARQLASQTKEEPKEPAQPPVSPTDPTNIGASSRLSAEELRVLGETLRLSDRDMKGGDD